MSLCTCGLQPTYSPALGTKSKNRAARVFAVAFRKPTADSLAHPPDTMSGHARQVVAGPQQRHSSYSSCQSANLNLHTTFTYSVPEFSESKSRNLWSLHYPQPYKEIVCLIPPFTLALVCWFAVFHIAMEVSSPTNPNIPSHALWLLGKHYIGAAWLVWSIVRTMEQSGLSHSLAMMFCYNSIAEKYT